jgi:biopolymer transport protein ExbD
MPHPVKFDLPQASDVQPVIEPVHLAIRADGSMSWNDVPIDASAYNAWDKSVTAARRSCSSIDGRAVGMG